MKSKLRKRQALEVGVFKNVLISPTTSSIMYRSYTNYRGAWKPILSPRLETRVRHLLVRLGIEYSHRTCEETEAKGRMLAGAHEYRKPDLNSYKSADIGLYSKQSE